jgi:predicted NBD/HSP70 family sugar kinase
VVIRDAPIRQQSLREHNLGLVLRRVAGSATPPSRADVAASTGLTKATVSSLVEELVAGQLVAELDPTRRSGAGRPATGLVLRTDAAAGLGLEINVDYLAACVVDLAGTVRHRERQRGDQRGRPPAEVIASVSVLADRALAAAARAGLTPAGAAMAVAGIMHGERLVRLGPNLGWRETEMPETIAGLPLRVDNEANLAALGELHAPGGADRNFLYISGEIGVGAGIVLDGRLFRGSHGWSGELGHVTVDPAGLPCRCGSRGCLEQYAGQEAILRAAGQNADARDGDEVARILALANGADPAMLAALRDAGTALGVAVAGMVNMLDVGTVILGNSYAPLSPWLIDEVEREVRERVITADWSPVSVRPSALAAEATVVGAAGSVVLEILENPTGWLSSAIP